MEREEKKNTCESASQTVEWIKAIIHFINLYRFFLDAHVVNFIKDKLWESVDKEWIDCLMKEPVENLLQIPSGVVQDHWPDTLKNFIATSRRLSISRDQADLHEILPDLHSIPLSKVLTQGMNQKKKHEVEALAAVISSVAKSIGANTIVDVGAVAIDASSHHGKITDARAERIRKHYAAKMRDSGVNDEYLVMPKTVTCHILSPATLRGLNNSQQNDELRQQNLTGKSPFQLSQVQSPLLLAGLHACGDLSITMLRSFLECDEVKAMVSIGCCYNLLSEGAAESADYLCGFPMSNGVKDTELFLGKNSRDLACQSADRWRGLEGEAGIQNFELHAFRASFQMLLYRYYPETLKSSPGIGRQGKAVRRQRNQRILESRLRLENKDNELDNQGPENGESETIDKYSLFEKFSLSALNRLGLPYSEEVDIAAIWGEAEPCFVLIGPYWSLRAALGPVLETLLLLDRLLFLQEQGDYVEAFMLPIFDPALSPRNVALIAKKS